MHELREETEPTLDDIIRHFSKANLILVEGYKSSQIPKIEARSKRSLTQTPLRDEFPSIVAVASDQISEEEDSIPHFAIDEISDIADFILRFLEIETNP